MLVLTYHSISDGPAPLCVRSERLADQLDFLRALDMTAVPLLDLIARLRGGGTPPSRCFAITFDDGYRDFLQSALPVLERRGLPATLFALPPGATTGESKDVEGSVPGDTGAPLLRREELREVAARGVEIGAHSLSHTDLTRLADAELERELAEGRRALEACSDTPVESLAYPFGRFDRRVRQAAGRHYRAAFTTQLAAVHGGIDHLAIPRVDAFYLDSGALRCAIAAGRPELYLTPRRWLRRVRGSEPRRAVPRPAQGAALRAAVLDPDHSSSSASRMIRSTSRRRTSRHVGA